MASTSDFLTAVIAQVPDGDKGDILVTSSGTQWNVDSEALIPVRRCLASAPISPYRGITLDVNGEGIYASSDNAAHMHRVIGISVESVPASTLFGIYNHEILFNASWSWSVGGPIYLGLQGILTQTPPVFPDVFSLRIGVALTPQIAEIEVQTPIKLIP